MMIRVATLLLMLCASVSAQSPSAILARLDRFAASFHSLRASVEYTEHTAQLPADMDTHEAGVLSLQRSAGKIQIMIVFTGADSRSVLLRGETAEIYYPKLNEKHEYDIRKYRNLAQTLLLLGFGMSGRDLAAHYEVRNLPAETIAAQRSTHLELIPKSADVLKEMKKVDLWISDKNDCAVQQRFDFPGGGYKIGLFSDVQINLPLPANTFELPKSAKRVRMN